MILGVPLLKHFRVLFNCSFFPEKIRLNISCERIHMKHKIEPYFLQKMEVKIIMSSAIIFVWHFKVYGYITMF